MKPHHDVRADRDDRHARRANDDLLALSHDVLYEVQMLFATANRLRDHTRDIARLP